MDDDERLAIGVGQDRVRPMFAGTALEFVEQGDLVEFVVAVGVADAVQTAHEFIAIDHDVETVERPKQPLGLTDVDGDLFDFRCLPVCRPTRAA